MSSSLAQDLERRSGGHFCVARRSTPITFAVVGRNEAATLPRALRDVKGAAIACDRVLFVDSDSTDDSTLVAERMGVRTVRAPVGKGRAIGYALGCIETPFVCFVDADIQGASGNIAAVLAAAVRSGRPDMVIGDFEDDPPGVASVTAGVYEPLVAQLFPEAAGRFGRRPLSGFRALRRDWAHGVLPIDFGVEAHLNITFALRGQARIRAVAVGRYRGPFRYKPEMGAEVARAVLDLAESHGRLRAEDRPEWEAWLDGVLAHIATYRGDRRGRERFAAELRDLAVRPLPASR